MSCGCPGTWCSPARTALAGDLPAKAAEEIIQQEKTGACEQGSGTVKAILAGAVRLLTGAERPETPEESRDRQLRAVGYGPSGPLTCG
jgi:hypothetical protein